MEASTLNDLLFANNALIDGSNQSSNVAGTYLNQLLRLSLSSLEAQPASLTEQSNQIDSELSSLCFRSFPTLLQSYASTKSLADAFAHLEDELGAFVDTSASLTAACRDFESSIQDNMAERSKVSQVLPQIDNVGDILDIPRLVGTCVSAGYWSEALDLAQRARDLEVLCESEKQEKARRMMQQVVKQVDAEMAALKIRVLEQMRERSLKLPGAVRAMALLRRLSNNASHTVDGEQFAQTEARFQLILLASRWDCLRFQLDALHASSELSTEDDRVKYLRRIVEIWREVIGDAASMFSEIFLAHADASIALSAKAPLNGFLHLALEKLLSLLQQHIQHVHAGSSLTTISTQLTYCSNAFATRVGFDFKPAVDAVIRKRLLHIVQERWDAGLTSLQQQLVGKTQPLAQLLLAPESLARVLALPVPAEKLSFAHQPPAQLALFPPLARFLNAIAGALNELRLLPSAAVSLHPILHEKLYSTLEEAGKTILAVIEASLPQPLPSDKEQDPEEADLRQQKRQIARIVNLWAGRVCLPWCSRALAEAAKDAGAKDVSDSVGIPNRDRFEAMNLNLQENDG